tara:strand:+ start:2984 stop:3751 length:768 start_codon:yes stop_codon:yes gene_type:complete
MRRERDKAIERERYEKSSKSILLNKVNLEKLSEYDALPRYLLEPYFFYKKLLEETIKKDHRVLEIGSGRGDLTGILLSTKADITATDISPISLSILNERYSAYDNLKTSVQDMENLSYEKEFDIFCSAGSLSYGSINNILDQAKKVLKPEGIIICVDSLNNNPIYKVKRYIDFLRNKRSLSTIFNMPTLKSLLEFNKDFKILDIKFFGSISWVCRLAEPFISEARLAKFSTIIDKLILVKGSAYKFVIIAQIKSN